MLINDFCLKWLEYRYEVFDFNCIASYNFDNLYSTFLDQLYGSKFGYSKVEVFKTPIIQDALEEKFSKLGFKKRKLKPTLVLSHDIDYFYSTTQLNIKKIVAQKKLSWLKESYLESIQKLVNIDLQFGSTSFFVCNPILSQNVRKRVLQWLLDPSYVLNSEESINLKSILSHDKIDIGVHGSFFSIEDRTLNIEKKAIANFFNKTIVSSRQHWLNLPHDQSFKIIESSGILFDSSIGWNNQWGFRGGFCDFFPIPGSQVWSSPLVLMDGTLFDAMGLSQAEVVKQSKLALQICYEREGCFAIDWHDRSFSASYAWGDAYIEILEYAKKLGFEFCSLKDAFHSRSKT